MGKLSIYLVYLAIVTIGVFVMEQMSPFLLSVDELTIEIAPRIPFFVLITAIMSSHYYFRFRGGELAKAAVVLWPVLPLVVFSIVQLREPHPEVVILTSLGLVALNSILSVIILAPFLLVSGKKWT